MNNTQNTKTMKMLSIEVIKEIRYNAAYDEAIDAGEDYQSAQQYAADMQGYTELGDLRKLSTKEVYALFYDYCVECREEVEQLEGQL